LTLRNNSMTQSPTVQGTPTRPQRQKVKSPTKEEDTESDKASTQLMATGETTDNCEDVKETVNITPRSRIEGKMPGQSKIQKAATWHHRREQPAGHCMESCTKKGHCKPRRRITLAVDPDDPSIARYFLV
jgi:hypothetical protein